MRLNKWVACSLLASVCGLTPGVAGAGLLPVTAYVAATDSPFFGAGGFAVETFEDGVLNTPGISISAGPFPSSSGQFTDSVDADDGVVDGSGQNGRSLYVGVASVTVTFSLADGGLPTSAGLVWTDVGTTALAVGSASFMFEAFGPGGVSLGTIGPVLLGDGSILGQTAEDRFFGVTNAAGITAITLSTTQSTDWEVDHLQYAGNTVPEPTGLAGLAPLAILLRRRR